MMIRSLRADGERGVGSNWACAFVVLLSCAAGIGVGPLLHGSTLRDVCWYELYLAVYTIVPGVLCYRLFAGEEEDAITHLGMGWMCGIVITIVVLLVQKLVGATALFPYLPLVLLPLFALTWRFGHGPRSTRAQERPGPVVLFCVLLFVAGFRAHRLPASGWWQEFDDDLYFHAGNAAELLHHWPLIDPRMAGTPLNYHFFAYLPSVGASLVTDIPMQEIMRRLACGLGPTLLALQLFIAGRAFGAGPKAGLIAAFVILLHWDVSSEVGHWFGQQWDVSSYLTIGLYDSPTTSPGLALFAALAFLIRRWLESPLGQGIRPGLLTILVAFAASGAKGSVMPVAITASAMFFVLRCLAEHRLARRALVLFGALVVASLPMTLLLIGGQSSFASAMLRFAPWTAMHFSGFFGAIAGGLGYDALDPPAWLTLAVLPVWLFLYLGLTGLGFALCVWKKRMQWTAAESWLLVNGICGIAIGLAFAAPGYSQLFFAYTGQIALALLAAVGLSTFRPRLAVVRVILCTLVVAISLVSIEAAVSQFILRWNQGASTEPLEERYVEGMKWLRANSPADAILLTTHPFVQLSVNAERRVFFETARFRPESHALAWKQRKGRWIPTWDEPPPHARLSLLRAFAQAPSKETFRAVRAEAPDASAYYFVMDDAQIVWIQAGQARLTIHALPGEDPRIRSPVLHIEFENAAMRIYRIVDD